MEEQASSIANSLAILGPFCLFVMMALIYHYSHKWRDTRDLAERTLREKVEIARVEAETKTEVVREQLKADEIASIREGYKTALKEQTEVLDKKDVLIERMRVEQNEAGKDTVTLVEGILTQVNDSSLVVGTNIGGLQKEISELRKEVGKNKRSFQSD